MLLLVPTLSKIVITVMQFLELTLIDRAAADFLPVLLLVCNEVLRAETFSGLGATCGLLTQHQ